MVGHLLPGWGGQAHRLLPDWDGQARYLLPDYCLSYTSVCDSPQVDPAMFSSCVLVYAASVAYLDLEKM